MAGNRGVKLDLEATPEWLFGEDQARYLVSVTAEYLSAVCERALIAEVEAIKIGTVEGNALTLNSADAIPVTELSELHEGWFPFYTSNI
jgi:phosphoribosylformylglycinamidine synthase